MSVQSVGFATVSQDYPDQKVWDLVALVVCDLLQKGDGRDVGICQRRRRIAQLGAPVRARSIVEPGEQETKAELGCHIQLRAEHVVQGGDSAWDVKQWEHGEFGQLEAMTEIGRAHV